MSKLSQFNLLLWKNWKLQLRKPVITFFEIFLPAFFCLVLLGLRTLAIPTIVTNSTTFQPYSIGGFPDSLMQTFNFQGVTFLSIAYTPDTPITRSIMQNALYDQIMPQTNGTNFALLQGTNSEEDMVTLATFSNGSTKNSYKYLGGVVFLNSDYKTSLPTNLTYKIRLSYGLRSSAGGAGAGVATWMTDKTYEDLQDASPRNDNDTRNPSPGYYSEGFLTLQNAINRAVMVALNPSLLASPDFMSLDVSAQLFPYPPFINDIFVTILQSQLPFILMLSFIFIALNIPKEVVHEKERKLKEAMKMMGLNNWLHWLAWFAKYFLFLLFTAGMMTLILCPPGFDKSSNLIILRYAASSVIFVYLILYAVATISFCFMISVFFSKANSAAAAGGILFFVSYIPYFSVQSNYNSLSTGTKVASCLLSNNAMALGAYVISKFEGTGEGIQWSNLMEPVSVDDNFTLAHVWGMLIADSALYLFIMWYVEAIFPGDYGIPQPPHFLFLPSYWCGTRRNFIKVVSPEPKLDDVNNETFYEEDPVGVPVGIQVKRLTKEFKTKGILKKAVNNVNLNFYEGQITALLGHNGAGKTTTMFMLTGFMPPTSGTALVNGYDICKDIVNVRSSLGLCPQHDILFDNLTVEEHLEFYAKLKKCPANKRQEQKDYYIATLGLQEKRRAYAQTLSGGQKRKLSVGIALIGDSKIVILDEPTSGMDPSARRLMWDVLQKQRAGRTMVLSTHFMDEADNLGDRIAIMAEGVVQCCGTSLFLKTKYGAGYHMVMVKKANCSVQKVIDVVVKHVSTAKMESNVGAELSFILPHENVSSFSGMFAELEQKKEELGITSYGASVTTMEEVFLKVGHGKQEGEPDEVQDRLQNVANEGKGKTCYDLEGLKQGALGDAMPMSQLNGRAKIPISQTDSASKGVNNADDANTTATMPSVTHNSVRKNTGITLQLQQFKAMFVKRVVYTVRNRILTLSQILMPTLFTVLTAAILTTASSTTSSPALTVGINGFGSSVVLCENANATNLSSNLISAYGTVFTSAQTVTQVNDLQAALLSVGKSSIGAYTFHRIIAASFVGKDATTVQSTAVALFNTQPYHAAPAAVAYLSNAMMNYFVNNTYSISTINHPLPETLEKQASAAASTFNGNSFSYSANLMFGMSFLASSFVVFLIKERATKVKHSQFVSGVKWYNFWFATFTWDFINYMVPAFLVLIIFQAFSIKELSGTQIPYVLLLLVVFGFALLPHMYLLQFLFTGPATGYVIMTFYNILSGIVPNLVVTILDLLDEKSTSSALNYIFNALFPNYNMGKAMVDLYENYEYNDLCNVQIPKAYGNVSLNTICQRVADFHLTLACCKNATICGSSGCLNNTDNYLAIQPLGMGQPLLFLAGQCLFSWMLIFLIEVEFVRKLFNKCRPKKYVTPSVSEGQVQDDDDVVEERHRLLPKPSTDIIKSSPVVIYGLSKYFADHHAVSNLCVAIPKGECFGLLGVNGAGKTTTFRMLTGDESVSGGNAVLNGHSVRGDILAVHQNIGYCPQFDALIDQMTGEETLYMFARLRGIPESQIKVVVQDLMDAFILTPHANKLSEKYSGGNKRKLSTAIALIGDPPIVFLDEPTTGMDPVARRMLWDALSRVRDSGKTLIMTSHSMEECEALCTRMAIMVNGQFKCLGSTQHLKNKFGSGYSLIARIGYPPNGGMPDLKPLMAFVDEKFPGSILKDIHQNLVQYQIKDTTLSWSAIFGILEQAKVTLGIEDYSVSQTTLEQVFINFARAQVPPEEEKERSCCSRLNVFARVCCVPDIVVTESSQ